MKSNVDIMINNLAPAIERKCEELQTARKERRQSRIFLLLCAAVIAVPALLVLAGMSLIALIVPLPFMSLSVIVLLPILLSGKNSDHGGNIYE